MTIIIFYDDDNTVHNIYLMYFVTPWPKKNSFKFALRSSDVRKYLRWTRCRASFDSVVLSSARGAYSKLHGKQVRIITRIYQRLLDHNLPQLQLTPRHLQITTSFYRADRNKTHFTLFSFFQRCNNCCNSITRFTAMLTYVTPSYLPENAWAPEQETYC